MELKEQEQYSDNLDQISWRQTKYWLAISMEKNKIKLRTSAASIRDCSKIPPAIILLYNKVSQLPKNLKIYWVPKIIYKINHVSERFRISLLLGIWASRLKIIIARLSNILSNQCSKRKERNKTQKYIQDFDSLSYSSLERLTCRVLHL